MRFDIVQTLEIPQGATELTTSQLELISGGGESGCKYGKEKKYGKSFKKGGYKGGYSGYGKYGKYKPEENYGDYCDY